MELPTPATTIELYQAAILDELRAIRSSLSDRPPASSGEPDGEGGVPVQLREGAAARRPKRGGGGVP
jgi:hypothetical protein